MVMNGISFREANKGDVHEVADMIRAMLADMALLGGYGLAEDEGVWDQMESDILTGISEEDHLYLLAEIGDVDHLLVGLVEARIVFPHQLFEQKRMLHIHALYV